MRVLSVNRSKLILGSLLTIFLLGLSVIYLSPAGVEAHSEVTEPHHLDTDLAPTNPESTNPAPQESSPQPILPDQGTKEPSEPQPTTSNQEPAKQGSSRAFTIIGIVVIIIGSAATAWRLWIKK